MHSLQIENWKGKVVRKAKGIIRQEVLWHKVHWNEWELDKMVDFSGAEERFSGLHFMAASLTCFRGSKSMGGRHRIVQ